MQAFLDSPIFVWFLLPLLILVARVVDVSLGTLRIVMLSSGRKFLAAILGFFEILVWLLVARQVIADLPNVVCFLAYAAGFSIGTYVGLVIEEKMVSGKQVVRVITRHGAALVKLLGQHGFGVTLSAGQGVWQRVDIVFTTIDRKDLKRVVELIHQIAPKAFYTVEDVRQVSEGVFPTHLDKGFRRFIKRK